MCDIIADKGGPSRRVATLVEGGTDDKDINGGRPYLHSLWINYNRSWRHSNAIFANDSACWRRVVGPRAITECLTFGGDGDGEATTGGEGGGIFPDGIDRISRILGLRRSRYR